jgi:hypothetical protein
MMSYMTFFARDVSDKPNPVGTYALQDGYVSADYTRDRKYLWPTIAVPCALIRRGCSLALLSQNSTSSWSIGSVMKRRTRISGTYTHGLFPQLRM